jgi:hypothetical protein
MPDRFFDLLKFLGPKPIPPAQAKRTRGATPSEAVRTRKKKYVRPTVCKLNFEQGALILLGRAWEGDDEAKQFLTHLYPTKVETKAIVTNAVIPRKPS